MKKRILLTAFGMSFALMACAKQKEPVVELTTVQETEEQQTPVNTTQEQEETTVQQTTKAEQETDKVETYVLETAAEEETKAEQETTQVKGTLTQADIAVTVRGVAIVPGENMENYIGALGEPDELTGVPSCIEEGDDKTYTYGGVLIYTYRANGTDQINLIEITGTESLGKGIHIGDTEETVIAAYGDAYTVDEDELLYEMNNKVIGLRMTDGKVSFMELFAR